jgi:protein phosphatase
LALGKRIAHPKAGQLLLVISRLTTSLKNAADSFRSRKTDPPATPWSLLRKGQALEKITSDHEVGQREIKRGVDPETAYARPDAYQLTQALGPRDSNFLKPEVQFLDLCEDTLLILASDGLTDNDLLETHWQKTLEPLFNPQANLDEGVAQLIELGNKRNGHDNITAIIIRAQVGTFRF